MITSAGITLDSVFSREVIPWDQLADIDAEGGLSFKLNNGGSVGTICYGDSPLGAMTGYRGLRRVRQQMLAAGDRYRSGDSGSRHPHHHERRKQMKIVWWPLLVYLVPFEAISIAADLAGHAH